MRFQYKPAIPAAVLLAVIFSCRFGHGAERAVPLQDLIAPVTGEEIDLAVFPLPRRHSCGGRALRLDAVQLEAAGLEDTPAARLIRELLPEWGVQPAAGGEAASRIVLRLIDPPAGWKPAPEQGYRLNVKDDGGRALIEIHGGGLPGLFYGVQTLRQLVHAGTGTACVREAEIEDWPSVRYRGPASAGNTRWKLNLAVVNTVWPPADPNAERRREAEQELAETIKRGEELEAEKDEPAESLDDLIDGLLGEQDAGAVSEDEERARRELHRSNIRQKQRLSAELKRLEAAYEQHKEEQLALARKRMQTWRDHHIEPVIQYNETTWSWGRISDSERLSSNHTNSVERLLRNLKTTYRMWYDLGARNFLLRFDYGLFGYYSFQRPLDAEEPTDPNFGEAQADVMHRIVGWLEELDPQNRFFLRHHKTTVSITPAVRHVSSWRTKRNLDDLAAELADAGLPEGVEIVWSGSGDPAPRLTADDARAMSGAFGGRPASFLDMNLWGGGRLDIFHAEPGDGVGSFIGNGPMEPHDPQLAEYLDMVSIRGWAGRQWGWNAEDYDPKHISDMQLGEWLRGAGGGPDAYSELSALAGRQRKHGHFAVVGRGWHVAAMLAEDQNAFSPEEVDRFMEEKRRFYDRRVSALREALPPEGQGLASTIEGEISRRLGYLERVAEVLRARPVATAGRAPGPIEPDGSLDKPVWTAAPAYCGLKVRKSWGEGGSEWVRPRLDTEFRVAYDDDYLYVAVFCEQPYAGKEGLDDSLQIVLDHTGSPQYGAYLTVTADGESRFGGRGAGRWPDLSAYPDTGPPPGWRWAEDFRVATAASPGGWNAEFAIPLKDLDPRHRPAPGRRWGFNVKRPRAGGGVSPAFWQPNCITYHRDDGPAVDGQSLYTGILAFE